MRSLRDAGMDPLKRTVIIAIFASLSVVLGVLESLIPFAVSIPGAKLGFGNIMVLTCLYFFSARDALTLIVLKTLLTSFVLGSFSTFLFSFLGAMLSFLVMLVMLRLGKQTFSLVAVSVAGGITHNIGQLGGAAIVLGTTKIYYYLPLLLISGVVTGLLVGFAAGRLITALGSVSLFKELEAKSQLAPLRPDYQAADGGRCWR